MQKTLKFFVPLLVFLGIAGFLFRGLNLDPHRVPSPLIGKPAPPFHLPELQDANRVVSPADFLGKVVLFNVWATWCASCRQEHPLLMQLARQPDIALYGLSYKDTRPEALEWLRRQGNPYVANAVDTDGRVAIDWGVYGTPETFIIDRRGIIRYKQIGPMNEVELRATILPLLAQLKAEN